MPNIAAARKEALPALGLLLACTLCGLSGRAADHRRNQEIGRQGRNR